MTLQAYQTVRRATLLEGTSPHQLIEMLYDGASSNISIARQHLASGDRQKLHLHVDKAMAIVQELQASLKDYETDELAGNLFELYSFLAANLIQGQTELNDEKFVVCAQLIDILKDAWQAISPNQKAA